MKISELFQIDVARSKGADDYDSGIVPFVTNTTLNNGVIKYVTPFPEDKTFEGPSLCISGLGHATLQHLTFLPKGNGGDSATILTPLQPMSTEELLYYTALFNALHKWRFSFGRKTSRKRIQELDISPVYEESQFDVESVLSNLSTSLKEHVAQYEQEFLVE